MKIKKTDSHYNLCFRFEGQKKNIYKFFISHSALISFLNKINQGETRIVYYTLSQTFNYEILED